MGKNTPEIWGLIEKNRPDFEKLSDCVWDVPETCYQETRSVRLHAEMLEQQGFRTSVGIGGIATAVMGEAGEGGPVIAFLGEYDALPGLSQEAGVASHSPVKEGGNGHGCGHNLLGAAAMLAAKATADWLKKNNMPGCVRYYGCPAEEGGGAKTFMVRAGLFDDVDAAFSWHPENFTEVLEAHSLANARVDFSFTGRAAHAAVAPHLGRSALDAVELMNVGVNYMREHMSSKARVHYAVIDTGGIAPNVVQAHARVRYSIRAPDRTEMAELVQRVSDVARGAALMTGTTVSIKMLSAVSNLLHNETLATVMSHEMERLGPPVFDEADHAFAREIQKTLTAGDISDTYRRFGLEPVDGLPGMSTILVPRSSPRIPLMGSTDLGDVSWVVPLVQLQAATCAIGTPFHSWQLTAQGKSPGAKKGMAYAALAMASAAVRLFEDPAIIEQAKDELVRRTARNPYASPLPVDAVPPVKEMAL